MQALDERTFEAAKKIRGFLKNIPYSIANNEDLKQLARSSGSVAANYIEANESLSKRDFYYRLKICRKESKESILWLRLIYLVNETQENERAVLIQEYFELLKIFTSIIKNK